MTPDVVSRAKAGDARAIREITAGCRRYVEGAGKEFRYRFSRQFRSIDYDDLLQAGYEGVLQAVQHYRAESGTKFSTYAIYAIRSHMIQQILQAGPVRAPKPEKGKSRSVHVVEMVAPEGGPVPWEHVSSAPPDAESTFLRKQISARINLLPNRQRQLIETRYGSERVLSWEKTGRAMNLQPTVTRRLARKALEFLRGGE